MFMLAMAMLETEEDRQLLEEVFYRYDKKMRRVAMRYLKNTSMAEDAAGAALLKIAEHIEKFKEIPCQERGFWIVSIVRNISLNMHRHDKLLTMAPQEDTPTPESTEGISDYHRLVQLIRALPETYRRVLELRFLWEWKNTEIARELGLPISTVEQRISRGRKMLQDTLRREGYYNDKP